MSFISQYVSSLKGIEAEEMFDLLVYRPIAFILVKATFHLNITPNHVSIVALTCGIMAGVAFSFGTLTANLIAALLYFLCNVLDCADGQIARLKQNGTKVGRIIDGSIDYIVSITVFVGIAIGLGKEYYANETPLYIHDLSGINPYLYIWIITILAGVSSAIHSFFFDYYRNKYLEIVYNKVTSLEEEIADFRAEREKLKAEGGHKFDIALISVYLTYSALQLKIKSSHSKKRKKSLPVNSKAYYRRNRVILRLWSFIGSTSHITVTIICALLNRMELFLLICIIPMNIFMLLVYLLQKRSNALLKI